MQHSILETFDLTLNSLQYQSYLNTICRKIVENNNSRSLGRDYF